MSPQELKQIRQVIEKQFRITLYNDVKFPFLPSMGIRHLFQGFENEEKGFVGILHLWWTNEIDKTLFYSVNHSGPKVKGLWKSEWFDKPTDTESLTLMIQKSSIVDEHKIVKIFEDRAREISQKNMNKALQERIQQEFDNANSEDEPILLN